MIESIKSDYETFVSNLGSSTDAESFAEADAIIGQINVLIGKYEEYEPSAADDDDIFGAQSIVEKDDQLENENAVITVTFSPETSTNLFIMFILVILSVGICAFYCFRKRNT
eukprot:UN12149